MIKIQFELNFNQKKRFAFLFREVKKVEQFDQSIYLKNAIIYTIHMDGISKDYTFIHPIECISFIHEHSHHLEENIIVKNLLIHDLSIISYAQIETFDSITHLDLAQLINYEDNINEMLDKAQKETDIILSQLEKQYYIEDNISKVKEINSEDIEKLRKHMKQIENKVIKERSEKKI
jgi:hypothetical protein